MFARRNPDADIEPSGKASAAGTRRRRGVLGFRLFETTVPPAATGAGMDPHTAVELESVLARRALAGGGLPAGDLTLVMLVGAIGPPSIPPVNWCAKNSPGRLLFCAAVS